MSLKPRSLTAKKRRPSQNHGELMALGIGNPLDVVRKYLGLGGSDMDLNDGRYVSKKKRNRYTVMPMLVFFVVVMYLLVSTFMPNGMRAPVTYPPEHGAYQNEVISSSPLIFPHVEHAPVLKEIGIRGLFILRMEMDGTKRFVIKPEDKPFSDEEKKKTTDQVLLVKKSFLDHGKLIFPKKNESPEFVVVTLVDFDNFDRDTIVKIVQNRVDYAQRHKYGIYVRWAQEFVTEMSIQEVAPSYQLMKASIMRAAIHAFPYAKYFLFLDQTSLIMNSEIPLQKLILHQPTVEANKQVLPILQHYNGRNVPAKLAQQPDLVFPQHDNGVLDLSAFIVANSLHGKMFLDYLNDPLVRDYHWDDIYTQYGHVLNWHPELLDRTLLVKRKTLASPVEDPTNLNIKDNKIDGGDSGYSTGDFIASLAKCKERISCTSDLDVMYKFSHMG